MRYHVLACDYDGTLASHGLVDEPTLLALERFRRSGRRLVLVSGRTLPDLLEVFPHLELFERVIAENGALLYRPATREELPLAEPPPLDFIRLLEKNGVSPLSLGRVIVATWEPHETVVLEAIRTSGLELQVTFNKGAVMVLPSGVNKATGLKTALSEMKLSPHNVAGVGDAENDHALLGLCECAVAVSNAIPLVKERADLVTTLDHGAGVTELIDHIIASDLQDLDFKLRRHNIPLGTTREGEQVSFRPSADNILIAGTSGSGKSQVAKAILERLAHACYQFCIVDPEGDYENFENAVDIGDAKRPPTADEVSRLLQHPDTNVAVNLLGIPIEDRPSFFQALLPRFQEMRALMGRPHHILIDESHHLLPSAWHQEPQIMPRELVGMILITVHPEHLSKIALAAMDVVIAVGDSPERLLNEIPGYRAAPMAPLELQPGEGVIWFRSLERQPVVFRTLPPAAEHRRHKRKYAVGELGDDRSFYFQGPEHKLNLRAQNLVLFSQIAGGVDDETWRYHLKRGDYSQWFRNAIKDEDLAREAEEVERRNDLSAAESRFLIDTAIRNRYTAPV